MGSGIAGHQSETQRAPVLIVFAGLPGTGKSTIAQRLAARLDAVYVRIDSIEQAIRAAGVLPDGADIGPAGYMAAYRLAADNLRLGRAVIADSVNPLNVTRDAYRAVAERAGVRCLDVEIICSDRAVHRHRVETRRASVDGLALPTWAAVEARVYEKWNRPHLVLDSAHASVMQSVDAIVDALKNSRLPPA